MFPNFQTFLVGIGKKICLKLVLFSNSVLLSGKFTTETQVQKKGNYNV
jgi:hypothetical protein